MTINAQLIEEAAARLGKVVAKTPLQFSKRLSKLYDAQIYIKREDLQEVRSFKIRGAFNKISSLTGEEKKRGIVCASAGNHAQGVAWSCDALKIKGAIFMPAVSPNQKVEKVRHFGGEYVDVILTGETFDDAYAASQQYAKDHNAVYVHPFNDPFTIAGQGTIAKEIYEELDGNFDVVIAPIGGGGLISGISTYVKEKKPEAVVMGVEPAGAAEMYESLKQNKVVTLEKIDTFVDGCAVKTAGDMTFAIAKKNLEKIIVVPEGKVCTTMIELYQRDGIIAEPSGALSISALDDIASEIKGKTVVCILSGGNNDILRYPEIMERSLVYQGRKHYFIIEFAQKPGQLKKFLNEALGPTDDISRFEYIKKTNKEKGPALVGVELKNKEDLQPLIDNMNKIGLNFHKLTPDQMLYGYLI